MAVPPVGNFSNIQTHFKSETRTVTVGNFILVQTVTVQTIWARHHPVPAVPAIVVPAPLHFVPAEPELPDSPEHDWESI